MLKEILRLKKTLSPKTLGPFSYEEIGRILGLGKQGVHYHAQKVLNDPKHPRCPSCLQPLKKNDNSDTEIPSSNNS